MAHIIPEGWQTLQATGAAQREIETLSQLAASLPDSYTLYHGVHWTRVNQGHALVGEIDFAIVNPAGNLLLIEQKSGFLGETPEGLVKQYAKTEKHVPTQMARSAEALRARLNQYCTGNTPTLDSLLYCPDYQVKQPGTAGIDPARIIDAGKREHLARIIRTLLPDDAPATPLADEVHRFLRNELRLVADVATVAGQARTLYTRLSGGLAEWARCIECEPFRLHVIGTAGSGKTQLALNVLQDAVAAGRRSLYVCYNRPLADHVARIAPAGSTVATYHQLCDRILRAGGAVPDFSRPGAFQMLEAFMADYRPDADWQFDEIIIDEGQDFQPAWRDALLHLLKPNGRIWWLEDPMQNLYGRPPVALPGWVVLRAQTNYRTPRDILATLQRLVGPQQPIESGSPLDGSDVEILTYSGHADLMDKTKTAITSGLGAGFKKDMMAVVTFRGREHSRFTSLDRLGPHAIKAFTGQYDLLSSPVYSAGDLFIESVHRFKGQSAPCIVFTEIDFEELDEAALRKLFVGMTRATMKLVMVVSERAAQTLMGRLNDSPAIPPAP
ncbi:MAG: ATP-dependent helicase [Thiobacillus sp.]|nr:ATP-dependent helicase [Thiobacillus sp.]